MARTVPRRGRRRQYRRTTRASRDVVRRFRYWTRSTAGGYPSAARLELEHGFSLVAPLTWLGLLDWLFAAAALGATVYGVWTLGRLLALEAQRGRDEATQV